VKDVHKAVEALAGVRDRVGIGRGRSGVGNGGKEESAGSIARWGAEPRGRRDGVSHQFKERPGAIFAA